MKSAWIMGVSAILLGAPPAQADDMSTFGAAVGTCLRKEAKSVAPKQVDLDTAGLAVVARCSAPLAKMRIYVMTGIPNFVPRSNFWEKEMEPDILKQARKLIAIERTR